jgi:SOS-response transcriptional repressor LexA
MMRGVDDYTRRKLGPGLFPRGGITPAVVDHLRAIHELTTETDGLPPTVGEIAARMGGRSQNGIQQMIVRLERLGLITRLRMKARTIRLTDAGKGLVGKEPVS